MTHEIGFKIFLVSFLLGLLVLAGGVSAATNVSSCQVINTSGSYVLNTSITGSTATRCIEITASDVVFDGAGLTIEGDDVGSDYGVFVNNSPTVLTNVTVKNLNLTDWYNGIYYRNAENGSIENNTINSNNRNGIYLYSSSNNTLTDNRVNQNLYGIYLDSSSNNNTISNNTANGPSQNYGILIYTSNNNTITDNNARSNNVGIYLYFSSSYNTVSNNNASSNSWRGIQLASSSKNNTITNNTANSNLQHGIYLDSSSSNNTITNNTASSNGQKGIYLTFSSYNTLSNNNASLNNESGIYLYSSSSNTLSNNTANSNKMYGIYIIFTSNNNTASNNTAMENNVLDFYIQGSSTACTNTLADNTGSGGRPVEYYNTTVNLSNKTLAELILCNADGSTITNVTIEGSTSLDNNGIFVLNTDNSTFTNVTSSNNYYGMFLDLSNGNIIANNTGSFSNNGNIGIYVHGNDNLIENNTIAGNTYTGIDIFDSGRTQILGNLIDQNGGDGIYSEESWDTTVRRNIITNTTQYGINIYDDDDDNQYNWYIGENTIRNSSDGIHIESGYYEFWNITMKNNTIEDSGRGVYVYLYLESDPSYEINIIGNRINNITNEGIFFDRCDYDCYDNVIANNTINGTGGDAISLKEVITSNITGNNITNSGSDGLSLTQSHNNIIDSNTIYNSPSSGIYVDSTFGSSDNNTITANNITRYCYGIFLNAVSYAEVLGNTIQNGTCGSSRGIYDAAGGTSYNTFSGNNISGNKYGIQMGVEDNTTVIGNWITNNTWGIYLFSSSDNTIYNNYLNNTNNAYDDGSSGTNTWNIAKTTGTNIVGGPCLGGNYWSDYNGNDTSGDGLGDTQVPYNSSGNITTVGDNLPLVNATSYSACFKSPASSGSDLGVNKPRVDILIVANSLDYPLATEMLSYLKSRGITYEVVNADEFDADKRANNRLILVLGGPDAPEGIGAVTREVLSDSEEASIRQSGSQSMYVKYNVWTDRYTYNQIVIVVAGSDRANTKAAEIKYSTDVEHTLVT